MNPNSPLRYPGGKAFLASELERIIGAIDLNKPVYVEPYAGGAGAALFLLFNNRVERIVINDLDKAIYAFWKSATEKSDDFVKKILKTPITIKEWERQKEIYSSPKANMFDRGFATFFLNRTNRSGVMSAGPIGGKKQNGTYKMDARYNKKELIKRIKKVGEYKNQIEVLNEDGISLVKRYIDKKNTFIYLDPPYFKKGALLYLNHYQDADHEELADLLNKKKKSYWVLTYDEVVKIRNLYTARTRKRISLNYRVHDSSKVRHARELMIFSDSILTK